MAKVDGVAPSSWSSYRVAVFGRYLSSEFSMLDATVVERKVSPTRRRFVRLSRRLQWKRRCLSVLRRTRSRCSEDNRVADRGMALRAVVLKTLSRWGDVCLACNWLSTRYMHFAAVQIRQVITRQSRRRNGPRGIKFAFRIGEHVCASGFGIAVELREENDVDSSVLLAALRVAARAAVVFWQPR